MLGLALRTLRSRLSGFVGAFVALLCAAAMVTACGILLDTGLRGTVPPQRYAGTPIIVAGDQEVHWTTSKDKGDGEVKEKTKSKPLTERAWIPADLAAKVAAVPGVAAVRTEVTFPATVIGAPGDGESWGHGFESAPLTPYALATGAEPKTGEVVLDAHSGAKTGDTVRVLTADGVGEYKVSGITATALDGQSSVFFSTDEAARLARAGQLTAIGVVPAPGTDTGALADAVRAALTGTPGKVYTGDDRGRLEFVDADAARVKLISMGGAIGGSALLVAILVVVGTFALSMQQRHREIALLRAIGATPRQMRSLIGREALLVGATAAPLGALAGIGLGVWLGSRFRDLGVLPEALDLVISPFPPIVAALATLLAAFVAARVSARGVIRVRPTEALSESGSAAPRVGVARILAGLLAVAGGVVLLIVLSGLRTEPAAGPVTFLTAIVWVVALSLLGPLLARAVAFLLTPVLSVLLRAGGYLAAKTARAQARRMASVITPLGLLVGMTATILFVPTTMGDAAADDLRAGTLASYTVAGHVPSSTAEAIRAVPGVTAATESLTTTVRVGQDKYRAQGLSAQNLTLTVDPGVVDGSFSLDGDHAAISSLAADQRGLSVGDKFTVTMGDGVHVELTVSAIYSRHLGFGDLLLPYPVVAAHVDTPLASTVLVSGTADAAALRAAAGPGLAVLNGAETADARDAAASANAEVQLIAMGLIIAFAAIAAVNTLAMATADRARELALLRLIGTTRRQVLLMLRTETAVAVVLAAIVGTGIALATLTAFASGMTGAARPGFELGTYAVIVGGAAALAWIATVLPGRVALRRQ
ncbi:ABC transporter permease [Actinorhabdospora filicis]|uniref:ABC transporter permease n=1 Tax=Actinorhabdospora filicis TaxID=1785913 RepID=A0A9W6W6V5_9ACTN|nr:ABC transporter permease [Actinorhabdospora filicis]GLZ75934.1 ABC transporter permease [Actinorhabdospora filicis]